jgi:hypothetical protein
MSWKSLQNADPLVARLGEKLLQLTGIAFLATTRADGSPRVHPVCPIISSGELLLCLIDKSPKSADLRRDPRCVLHTLPGPGHEEFWVEAIAQAPSAVDGAPWISGPPPFDPPDGDTLYRLNLLAAHATIFKPGAGERPVPDRRHWSADSSAASSAPVRALA